MLGIQFSLDNLYVLHIHLLDDTRDAALKYRVMRPAPRTADAGIAEPWWGTTFRIGVILDAPPPKIICCCVERFPSAPSSFRLSTFRIGVTRCPQLNQTYEGLQSELLAPFNLFPTSFSSCDRFSPLCAASLVKRHRAHLQVPPSFDGYSAIFSLQDRWRPSRNQEGERSSWSTNSLNASRRSNSVSSTTTSRCEWS